AGLLGLLHQDAGNVRDAALREVRRQLEHDLDGMARRQVGVGITAERPSHRDAAFRYLHIGTDGEVLRLPGGRRYPLRTPTRRTDEALALLVVRILLLEHDTLRHRRGRRDSGRL